MKKNEHWYEKRNCHNCDGVMLRNKTEICGFEVRGWKCKKCGESILLGADAQRVMVFNQLKKGIPVKLGTLGNSYIIRIPKRVYDALEMKNKEICINFNIKKNGKKEMVLEF